MYTVCSGLSVPLLRINRQRCRVSYFTEASNWYCPTVGEGLLFLQQVRVGGGVFISSVFSLSFIFLSLLSLPFISIFLSLFSLSLGDDTKWPIRVDVSLNPNTIKKTMCGMWRKICPACDSFKTTVVQVMLQVWTNDLICTRHTILQGIFGIFGVFMAPNIYQHFFL